MPSSFGKLHGSMFTGSMVGCGAMMFAVMSYVVANGVPHSEHGGTVELNPKLLAMILGESEEDVVRAIQRLCEPDENSRSKACEGRRLVKVGQFEYRIVNFLPYREPYVSEARKIYNRDAKRREREKLKKSALKNGKPLPGEAAYVSAVNNGDSMQAERIIDSHL